MVRCVSDEEPSRRASGKDGFVCTAECLRSSGGEERISRLRVRRDHRHGVGLGLGTVA